MLHILKDNQHSNAVLADLSLNRRERVSSPIAFREKQRQRIEEALRGEWRFATVEMDKRGGA